MEIAYAAHTESCTFLLDGEGICRFVTVPHARGMLPARARHADAGATDGSGGGGRVPDHADRCIGAQYVASIDLGVKGGLIDLPRPGAPLVFARIEADGRIALVRSGPLVRFEPLSAGGSGVRARPQPVAAPLGALRDSVPARSSRPPVPDASDEERTRPYRPSNPPIAAARRSPTMTTRPSHADDAPARPSPLPRLPGPPRVPQGMVRPRLPSVAASATAVTPAVARMPVPRPTRTPPAAPSSAPTRPRAPSVIRAAVTPARARDPMRTLEPDGEDGITTPQRRAR